MRLKTKSHIRRFHFERLENRTLLAGNVTTVLYSGELHISGDNANNNIQISQLPTGQ